MSPRAMRLCFATSIVLITGCNGGSSKPGAAPGDANALNAGDTGGGTDPDAATGTDPDADDTGDAAAADQSADATANADQGDDAVPSTCPPPALESCIDPASAPSYANTIAPILDRSCNTCHDPNIPNGPWPLTPYLDVLAWAPVIADDLAHCTMPPPDGGTTLTETDRQLLFAWLTCDSPDN